MSSQPGKNEAQRGGDSPAGEQSEKVKQTVAASASKPGRDEAVAESTSAEETKADLPRIEEEKPGWSRPAEPAASVSSGRAEGAGMSFGAPESSVDHPVAGSGAAAGPGNAPSAPKPGPGTSRFGNVLKNRQARSGAAGSAGGAKGARKAQLQLARLEPWSVMKFSFVMSLVCFVVLLVAVIVLYAILSGLGVFSAITDTVSDLTRRQGETSGGLDAGSWFSFARVFGYTVLVGALNVLLITALSTVGSVIYNLAADLVGGVEVTLKEAE
ncbi:DUF3566 domain-containing protein [Actinomadura vinacea]|uniref:DUF3566 domain-containing protein n=1 Tax=Actinomadura vinacea TaxID=115336 RepID=A0ABN3JXR6_9ACTN